MEKINLTQNVLDKVNQMGSVTKNETIVLRYLLNESFTKIYGDYELDEDKVDIVTLANNIKGLSMEISSIWFGNLVMNITANRDSNSVYLDAFADNKRVLTILKTNNSIRCNTVYEDVDNNTIDLLKEVNFEARDARRFFLTKKVNNELIYCGELKPILAKTGSHEFFAFKSNLNKPTESKSMFQRIVEAMKDDSLVGIPTAKETCSLSGYCDIVFDKLEEKLEAARTKQIGTAKKLSK